MDDMTESGGGDRSLAHQEPSIKSTPLDPEAHSRLGSMYHHEGKLDNAERLFRRAVELSPHEPAYHNNLGNVLCDLGRTAEGVTEYRLAIRLAGSRDLPEAQLNLELALLEQRLVQERLSFFENAVSLSVDSADSRCALGCSYLLRGDTLRAIAEFRQAILLDPTHHQAAVNLVFLYTVSEPGGTELKEALAEAKRISDHLAGEGRLLLHAAELYEAAGVLDAAGHRILRALEIDPECLEAYDLAGRFCEIHPEWDDQFHSAVEGNLNGPGLAPKFAGVARVRVLVGAARFFGTEDAWTTAQKAVEALVETEGETSGAMRLAAEIVEKLTGDCQAALQMHRRAAELGPRDFAAHFDLGGAFLRSGRIKEALDAFAAASELAPAEATVFQALRFALNTYRRVRTAELRFEMTRSGGPEAESAAHERLGRTFLSAFMYDEARSHLESAVAQGPNRATAHSSLGKLHSRLANFGESRCCYERALSIDADLVEAQRGIAALAVRTRSASSLDALISPNPRRPGPRGSRR